MASLQDFLAWETEQELRYELVDGLVRAMRGGTADHNTIVLNLATTLRAATRGRGGPCRVFAENMKVIVAETVMYPDVVLTCASVDPKADAVAEPLLIIEVLSRSTHEIDRGRKWLAYQQIESLRQYVLVSQDQARVESYRRTDEGWSDTVVEGPSNAVTLERQPAATPLPDIYESSSVADAGRRPSSSG